MERLTDKKIAVIGIGGVGGYLGALLADKYPNVSFVARAGRKTSIEENGLVLHSDYRGEKVVHPMQVAASAKELEPQDYIFICVKNYSLEDVCRDLDGCLKADTVIIPVMNGADPGERTRQMVPKGIVLDSLIYIVAFANPDYAITQQGMFSTIHLGLPGVHPQDEGEETQKMKEAHQLLSDAGVDCFMAEDISREIWKKYIFNCAYNVESAAYNNAIGEIRKDKTKTAQFEALILEAYEVAKAKHIHVTQEDIDALLHRFREELADDATSSLQRDVNARRTTELETFSGYLVREARRLGVAAPVSEMMYKKLREIIVQHA